MKRIAARARRQRAVRLRIQGNDFKGGVDLGSGGLLLFESHAVDFADELHAELVTGGWIAGGVEFVANGLEFAGVEPEAAAAGAFIDFD